MTETTSNPTRPNILLITLDQFRAECLSAAGHPLVQTPNLDRLASQGVRFSQHYSNCAPCAPARASLLTGLWQMNHRVTWNGTPLDDRLPMLPRLLRDLGYDPTLFGYTDTGLDPRTLSPGHPGLRNWEEAMPGFSVELMIDETISTWLEWLHEKGYEIPDNPEDIYTPQDVPIPPDRGATWQPSVYTAEHSESAFLTERAISWLRRQASVTTSTGEPRPWCAHLSYLRPHPPYLMSHPFHDLIDPADVDLPVRHVDPETEMQTHLFLHAAYGIVPSPDSELDQRQLQATYYAMIAEVDHYVGILLDELDRLGCADDTLVVLTSDHGEQLGDHWLVEKLGFFDQSYHIPLIIRWPHMTASAGKVVNAFTENVDILPTILDILGEDPPELCDGFSLKPFLDTQADGTEFRDDTSPRLWRDAVHFEFDFRDPTTMIAQELLGIRHDQCGIAVLRDRHGKYVHFGGLDPVFFDFNNDPGELHNVANDPARASQVLDYAQRLLSLRMQHLDPTLTSHRITSDGIVHRPDPPRAVWAMGTEEATGA